MTDLFTLCTLHMITSVISLNRRFALGTRFAVRDQPETTRRWFVAVWCVPHWLINQSINQSLTLIRLDIFNLLQPLFPLLTARRLMYRPATLPTKRVSFRAYHSSRSRRRWLQFGEHSHVPDQGILNLIIRDSHGRTFIDQGQSDSARAFRIGTPLNTRVTVDECSEVECQVTTGRARCDQVRDEGDLEGFIVWFWSIHRDKLTALERWTMNMLTLASGDFWCDITDTKWCWS